jgi:Raf kinase inhibitor-like YbhB/YbcL family protein
MAFELYSQAFENEGLIPDIYTCKGKEISPPLGWKNPPEGTKSYAILMEDLDVFFGSITHWVLYNIPFEKSQLPADIPHQNNLADGIFQGKNSMRKIGYMGPCPPFSKHRYIFTIYAVDTILSPDPKMNKKRLIKSINGHILDKANLLGYYSKK